MTTVPGPAPLRLPRHEGRGPRVALLVYNDAHNDARVIKEATSLREAGAQVRVFAVARQSAGHGEGEGLLAGGIEVTRSPELSLARHAPRLLNLARRLTGRPVPPAPGRPGQEAGAGPASQPAQAPASQDAATQPAPPATAPGPAEGQPAPQPGQPAGSPLLGAVRRWAKDTAWDCWMRSYRTGSLGLYWADAARQVLAWGPDVVHANDANTLPPALWVCAHAPRTRLVYDSHELWLHRNVRADRPLAPHVEALVERAGVRRADAVVTVSPSIVDWLADHYHLATPPALVRNVPAAGPLPDPARGRLRELAGLPASARVIAYGGRVTTSRGIEETLHALALLPPDTHLVMLGYGDAGYLATLGGLATRLGVAHRVHRVGPVAPDEVSQALSDGDVSVVHVRPTCLSYRYALPNKLFESVRAGLPVVAANLPDLAAVVRELGVGEVFGQEPGPEGPTAPADPATQAQDAEQLAGAISRVMADPAPYRAAARAACPTLTWENEARTLIATYRRALMGERA